MTEPEPPFLREAYMQAQAKVLELRLQIALVPLLKEELQQQYDWTVNNCNNAMYVPVRRDTIEMLLKIL